MRNHKNLYKNSSTVTNSASRRCLNKGRLAPPLQALTDMTRGILFITSLFFAWGADAAWSNSPPVTTPPPDWATTVRSQGISLDSSQYDILHQFEKQGVPERQVVNVNLVQLAQAFPQKAQQWIDGATPILKSTFRVSENHPSFKRTRTSFLKSFMAAMWAEADSSPRSQIFTAENMVASFNKFHHSAKSFYDISAVFYAYSNLVSKGLMPAGRATLKEAALQFKIANYKNKMDIAELSENDEVLFRTAAHPTRARRIASVGR